MGSIYLFSDHQGRCVELKVPGASSFDLAQLHIALPRNVSGLSFTRPEVRAPKNGRVHYHSISKPDTVAQHLAVLGEKLLGSAEPLAALRFFDLAHRMSFDASHILKRAEAMVALGRIEEATREIKEVIKQDPQNNFAYLLLGKIALHQERYLEASGYFSQAIENCNAGDLKEVSEYYLRFTQIFQGRDQLHTRNLTLQDYATEIEKLRIKVQVLRGEIATCQAPSVQGMEVNLDVLENLFANWLRELSISKNV